MKSLSEIWIQEHIPPIFITSTHVSLARIGISAVGDIIDSSVSTTPVQTTQRASLLLLSPCSPGPQLEPNHCPSLLHLSQIPSSAITLEAQQSCRKGLGHIVNNLFRRPRTTCRVMQVLQSAPYYVEVIQAFLATQSSCPKTNPTGIELCA